MGEENIERPLPFPDAVTSGTKAALADAPVSSLLRLARIFMLGPRAWKRWWLSLVRSVSHADILVRSEEDATFTFSYAFMVAIASGIATIGLLLNSPAVIIGAMLISPLMGPIVSTGFAIAGFDVDLGKRCSRTLLAGAVAAVGFAAAIAILSPVKELTPEILARTRPNLLDLAVAILSGAAGGYAMIRQRGGAIVGVAIATALMPPLSVVGYGLATWQWPVVRGALLLFVTNMVAIALAVAAIAEWYGFGRSGLRKRFAVKALVSLLILAPLSVPLFFSLKSIAWESRVHATVRNVLEAGVLQIKNGQLAQFHIRFLDDESPVIDALIVSEESRAGFTEKLRGDLQKALNTPVTLHLTQLRADDPDKLEAIMENERAKALAHDAQDELVTTLRGEVPFTLSAVEVDAESRSIVIVPQPRADAGLDIWRDIERVLAGRHDGWNVKVIPPPTSFPVVEFASETDNLDAIALERLSTIVWALKRWDLHDVELVGRYGSKTKTNHALAKRRLNNLAEWFRKQGYATQTPPRPKSVQRDSGAATDSAIEIILPSSRRPGATG